VQSLKRNGYDLRELDGGVRRSDSVRRSAGTLYGIGYQLRGLPATRSQGQILGCPREPCCTPSLRHSPSFEISDQMFIPYIYYPSVASRFDSNTVSRNCLPLTDVLVFPWGSRIESSEFKRLIQDIMMRTLKCYNISYSTSVVLQCFVYLSSSCAGWKFKRKQPAVGGAMRNPRKSFASTDAYYYCGAWRTWAGRAIPVLGSKPLEWGIPHATGWGDLVGRTCDRVRVRVPSELRVLFKILLYAFAIHLR
jgi:hypothetical protein